MPAANLRVSSPAVPETPKSLVESGTISSSNSDKETKDPRPKFGQSRTMQENNPP